MGKKEALDRLRTEIERSLGATERIPCSSSARWIDHTGGIHAQTLASYERTTLARSHWQQGARD